MATSNRKRKADVAEIEHLPIQKAARVPNANGNTTHIAGNSQSFPLNGEVAVQIVTGSYERVLHGICAKIPSQLLQRTDSSNSENYTANFSNTFLFAAHASSIRCLAISPSTESNKRTLATGSSDERIHLFNLSTTPPTSKRSKATLPALDGASTLENPKNRSLGNLNHHERAITRLQFPTKSKLFSAAEDNSIAISRTRDWTVLSSIKAPVPKPQGRPSGDTAGPGEVPAGINDFAIHPSQKLMLSVGRGERCMRLWNLMTGKKAGVLNFERELLVQVGEGKHGSGEGRCVLWNENGESFVVGFERGAAVFGVDSKPKAIVKPSPPTKFHQMRFLPQMEESSVQDVLAVSTEDGRILIFDTQVDSDEISGGKLPSCNCLAELGGTAAGISGRIKSFEILQPPSMSAEGERPYLIVTGSSDGAVRLWTLLRSDIIVSHDQEQHGTDGTIVNVNGAGKQSRQVGKLIGTLDTGNRITCLGAFVMDGTPGGDVDDGLDPIPSDEGDEDDSESSGESDGNV